MVAQIKHASIEQFGKKYLKFFLLENGVINIFFISGSSIISKWKSTPDKQSQKA